MTHRSLFRNARREALVALALILAALAWSVGYSYLFGYLPARAPGVPTPAPAPPQRQTFGMPDWVLYGIFLPWVLCTAATVWFGLFGMADDDLGAEADGGAAHGH
jgi:hypothetical protein